jgi:hypothetical protein
MMNASPQAILSTSHPPVNPAPATLRIPQWEQIPAEKRQELTQVLADLLVRQLQRQAAGGKREQPS